MTHGVLPTVSQLDAAALDRLYGQSLLITAEWEKADLEALLRLAEAFQVLDRAAVKTPLLSDELGYAVFFDQSTRTKSAWSGAAARLGMHPVIVDGSSTQVSHGETAEETGAMLGMNSHALGVRHDLILGEGNSFMRDMLRGISDYLKHTEDPRQVPLVNLQCDIDHPTQTMADLQWLRERFGEELHGKKVAVSWAYSPSYAKPLSVPQGLIMLLPRFGMDVTLAHPQGYELMGECLAHAESGAADGGSFRVVNDMDEAFRDADIVYPKSWGPYELMLERVEANKRGDKTAMADIEKRALERNASHTDWICDERRMGLTRDGQALYLHCLPADQGAEVAKSVYHRYQQEVAREANKKVYIIMALLAGAKLRGIPERLQQLVK